MKNDIVIGSLDIPKTWNWQQMLRCYHLLAILDAPTCFNTGETNIRARYILMTSSH